MKNNITILIGIVVLVAVLYGGSLSMKKSPVAKVSEVEKQELATKEFVGEVIRSFEGDHMLEYSLPIPETASTTVDMDGALIRVTNENNPLATIYISYEGGRGYNPLDYINNVITPHVAVINPTDIFTIGEYEWQGAESEGSEWRVAKVLEGEWLVVVENKKTSHDIVEDMLKNLSIK